MRYRFGDCELDTVRLELRRAGAVVQIEPQVFDLLRYLVERPDAFVSKDELFESVWHGRTVSDAALSSRIKAVRQAIGDTGTDQNLIRTIHGRGFRFVGSVSIEDVGPSGVAIAPGAETAGPAGGSEPALAVIPFENLSADADQRYFADGIAEDIINALAAWRYFPVIGRSVSFAYRDSQIPQAQVARELGVRYILSGSVRKAAERLRVSLQLLDATSGQQVWSETFDRTLEDIFDIQDQITQRVAAMIAPELERIEGQLSLSKNTENLASWDACQRGIALLHKFTKDGNEQARAMFLKAIELDPEYSKAFTGLAYSYHRDLFWDYASDREKWQCAFLAAAEKAVMLDTSDSSARVVLSYAQIWPGNHEMAIAEAREAIDLNPGNAFSHIVLGEALDMVGQRDDALQCAKVGVRLNERDPRIHTFLGVVARIYLSTRDYGKAEEWARRALTHRPDYPHARIYCGVALAYQDRIEAARRMVGECAHQPIGLALCYRNPADNQHMHEGLLKAGWSEPDEIRRKNGKR